MPLTQKSEKKTDSIGRECLCCRESSIMRFFFTFERQFFFNVNVLFFMDKAGRRINNLI